MPQAIDKKENLGLWRVIKSVFSAIFGIQSDANRQQDFKQGDPSHFIVVGIIVVIGIVITMLILVNAVLG